MHAPARKQRPEPDPEGARRARATRPRTKPAEVRREELLDAAERLFVGKGFGATRIEEVVAAADVAKGTFYLHFDSKDALLVALRRRFVSELADEVQAAMDRRPARDWSGRLRAFVAASVAGHLARRALHDVVFHALPLAPGHADHQNLSVERLAALLEAGAAAGAWQPGDPRLTAAMLFHALHGALEDHLASLEPSNVAGLVRRADRFYRRALGLR